MTLGSTELIPVGKIHNFIITHPKYPLKVTRQTVSRWVNSGVCSKSTSRKVYLRTHQIGGMVFCSIKNYEEFVESLSSSELADEEVQGEGE